MAVARVECVFHDAVFPKKATRVFFLGNFGNLQCIDRMISIQSLQFLPMPID